MKNYYILRNIKLIIIKNYIRKYISYNFIQKEFPDSPQGTLFPVRDENSQSTKLSIQRSGRVWRSVSGSKPGTEVTRCTSLIGTMRRVTTKETYKTSNKTLILDKDGKILYKNQRF